LRNSSNGAVASPATQVYHPCQINVTSGTIDQVAAYNFEWDPMKAFSNLSKHGVSFDHAATVFLDADALTVYDEANSLTEERWFTLGFDMAGNLLAVAHTYQILEGAIRIRIISARKATKRERQAYEDELR
jgi:uncharacterized DUF497 family protein